MRVLLFTGPSLGLLLLRVFRVFSSFDNDKLHAEGPRFREHGAGFEGALLREAWA